MTFGMMFVWWAEDNESVNEETMVIVRTLVEKALRTTGLDHFRSY
jgi:hypothetical protein